MRKFVPLAFSILFLAASSFAQVPTPDPGDVVKISTNLIQVDVTVTDKNGEPITDLRPDEVEIYENGKKKKITNFSFVPGTRPQQRTSESGKSSVAGQALLPGSPVRLESVRRSVAIVVDDLSMSFASSFWATDALRKFIKNDMQDGDLVSIIRTSGGSGILQQFTTDRRQLLAAIDRPVRGGGGISFFTPIRDVVGASVTQKPGRSKRSATASLGLVRWAR